MTVKPEDVYGLTSQERAIIRIMEAKIDYLLESRAVVGESIAISHQDDLGYLVIPPRIRRSIERMYSEVGWNVHMYTMNRVGAYWLFSMLDPVPVSKVMQEEQEE